MGPAFALGALIWVAILAYAEVQSGLAEIQHSCLSVLGALKGDAPDPSCASKGGAGSPPPGGDQGGGVGGAGALAAARRYLGCPYVFGGADCSPGIDCSGLTMRAWESQGVHLPHQSAAQHAYAVSRGWGISGEAGRNTPGALLFFVFRPQTEIHHVAISVGDGKNMVSADHPGKPVSVEPIFGGGVYAGAAMPRGTRPAPPPGGGGPPGGKK